MTDRLNMTIEVRSPTLVSSERWDLPWPWRNSSTRGERTAPRSEKMDYVNSRNCQPAFIFVCEDIRLFIKQLVAAL